MSQDALTTDQDDDVDVQITDPVKTNRHAKGIYLHAVARSPYSLSRTAFLATYLTKLARLHIDYSGRVKWLFFHIQPTSYVGTYVAIATFGTALTSPVVGAIADYSPHRRGIGLWTAVAGGIFACIMALLAYPGLWWLGGLLYIGSFLMFEYTTALIFAFLPNITPSDQKRTHIVSISVVWGNLTQIVIVLVMTLILLFASDPNLHLIGGSFETEEDESYWKYTSYGEPILPGHFKDGVCGVDEESPYCAQSDLRSHSDLYSLEMEIEKPPLKVYQLLPDVDLPELDPEIPGQEPDRHLEDADPDYVRSRQILLTAWLSADLPDDVDTADLALTLGPESANVTDVHFERIDVSNKFNFLRLTRTIPHDNEEYLQIGVVFGTNGTFFLDDISIVTDVQAFEPFFMLFTGVWWIVLSFYSFYHMDNVPPGQTKPKGVSYLRAAIVRLYTTLSNARKNPEVFKFLLTVMFLSNGIIALVSVVGPFFQEVLHMSSAQVGIALLSAQLFGIAGAVAGSWLGRRAGLYRAIVIILLIWNALIPIMYFVLVGPSSKPAGFIVAALFGSLLGAGLSLFRGFLCTMVPAGQEAEFMCLYDFFGQVTSWSGALVFTLINEHTNSIRLGILSMDIFFFLALVMFLFVRPTQRVIDDLNADRLQRDADDERESQMKSSPSVRNLLESVSPDGDRDVVIDDGGRGIEISADTVIASLQLPGDDADVDESMNAPLRQLTVNITDSPPPGAVEMSPLPSPTARDGDRVPLTEIR